MISVSGLTVAFGADYLFDNISFLINPTDRVGLAGKNGAGKSTMLRILAGAQNPTKGEVSKPNNVTIAYLPQDMRHQSGKTVFEEAAEAFKEINFLEAEIEKINKELEVRTDYETDSYSKLIENLTDYSTRLDLIGGYNFAGKIETVLLGLGFTRSQFQMQTSEFSGGWRMRIELAKLLLQNPDFLLLDEPTNHLDIEAIEWLESYLSTYTGAVVLVSHDRQFLDNITKRTIEISNQTIYDYKANYSKYLILRKERRESQTNAAKNQQKYIDQTQRLIDQYKAKASKASFAQSLMKKLDKLDIIEVDEEDNAAMRFRFPPAAHSGKIALEVKDVGKAYGSKRIFGGANFILQRGDKIGLIGKNGEGKSTMIKLINKLESYDGEIIHGHQIKIGYFAQNQAEELDFEKTVFETIDDLAAGEIRKNVRGLLGSFLFSGEDVDKKVKVLSGGERNRLAMCKLLLEPYNLLILDEPTNHLDLRSKDILKQALQQYDGTLVIVSHDRDFMAGLTNLCYEFRGGNVYEHIGDIMEFVEKRKRQEALEKASEDANNTKTVTAKPVEVKKEIVSTTAPENKNKNRIKIIEQDIEKLETSIATLEKQMAESNFFTQPNSKTVLATYEEQKSKLDKLLVEWEELAS